MNKFGWTAIALTIGLTGCANTAGQGGMDNKTTGAVVGEIHAYPPPVRAFAHVFGDLTVAVAPAWQGRGVGRALFGALLAAVQAEYPHVRRVELLARESNARAIGLYESVGFRREGRLAGRVRGADGSFEADIPLAWHAPGAEPVAG